MTVWYNTVQYDMVPLQYGGAQHDERVQLQ